MPVIRSYRTEYNIGKWRFNPKNGANQGQKCMVGLTGGPGCPTGPIGPIGPAIPCVPCSPWKIHGKFCVCFLN